MTTDGPVDIISGDGKFTMIADTEEPHFSGAIRALGIEVLDGTMVKAARSSYIERYGNPKLLITMPEGTGVRTPEGQAAMAALSTLRGPDGFGALPNGSEMEFVGLNASQSTVFKDAIDSVWQFIAVLMLGSDGTMTRGTGVYTSPMYNGIRYDIVDRMLKAITRGVNSGAIAPWLAFNYAQSIATTSGWVDPVVSIPLPDPDSDARAMSYAARVEKLHSTVTAERAAGFEVTQERVEQLCKELSIAAPTLAIRDSQTAIQLKPEDTAKVIRVDEARAAVGLDPVGDDRGELFISELDAAAKTTEAIEQVAAGETPNVDATPTPTPSEAAPPEQTLSDSTAAPSV
jgi:hypothetical protein